jgi:FKBP-type peptidyl-prolyl cis-trans isomerase FklB
MKKLCFGAIVALFAALFTGCGNSTPKANLKTDVDTLSYAVGMAQTQGLKEYLTSQGIDTTYMDELIKGLNDGANAGDDKSKAAYYAGIQLGQMISNRMVKGINQEVFGDDSTKTISLKNLLAGFVAGTTGNFKVIPSVMKANEIAQMKMVNIKGKYMEKQYGPNKAAGEKFLAANKKKPGVVTLPSGVQYKVIKEGKGAIPSDTSMVTVNYEGRTIDGKIFDSSYKRKEPVNLRANQVIKGWTEVLTRMPVGSAWEVYIPQELAYGERMQGEIKPYSCLIFKIELVGINK